MSPTAKTPPLAENAERARDLLTIALATYRADILPSLTAEQRYAGAMIANAMDIACRELAGGRAEHHLRGLMDAEGGLAALARDIRARKLDDAACPELRQALLDHVGAELEISNPRFLERRRRARSP